MRRLVLETAIGPVLALLLGKLSAARWDSAGATAEGTQDPAPIRAAGQGLATTHWRASAQRNTGEPGLTLAAARILGRPADPAGHPEDHRVGANRCQANGQRKSGFAAVADPQRCALSMGSTAGWLSFRWRLEADAANPCEPGPERPEPQGHGASEHPHLGLRPEHDLLIRGQDQGLGEGHVVRLGADVALAIEEQHPQQLAGGIKQMH